MFHLKRPTLKSEYFTDFIESMHSHLHEFMTYSFVDVYEFFVNFIASLHYKIKYLKYFDINDRELEATKQMTNFELFSNEYFIEDSFANCCFTGKFMVVSKCRNCKELSYFEEDFLSLNFDVFKSGQSKHIIELRKNFNGESSEPTGFFKVFSKEYWNQEVKDVTINDYISN